MMRRYGQGASNMPSQPQGPISALVTPIAEAIQQHNALPPDQKNRARASGGAGLIAFCLYALITVPGMIFGAWMAFAIWAALLGFGALWLYVGIRASIGPRDIMAAFLSGVAILFFIGLMVFGAYLPDDWLLMNFLLKGLYIGSAAASAMKLWLAVRGLPGVKLDDVRAQQAHGHARDATADEAATKLDESAAPRPPRQFHS
jgi:hypothetical protein